jgi:hypothetical protein
MFHFIHVIKCIVSSQSVQFTNFQKFRGFIAESTLIARKKTKEINDMKEVQNFKQNATDFVEDKEKRGINIYRIYICIHQHVNI